MALTLSSNDVANVERVFTTIVSPFSHECLTDWRVAVRTQLVELLGADRSVSMLPIADEPLLESSPGAEPAIDAYARHYHTLDTGLAEVRKQRGLEVFDLGDIYDLRTVRRTEIWNDWLVPAHFHDALALAIDIDATSPPAGFWFYHEHETSPVFGERGPELLRLLLPALKAGLHSIRQFAATRSRFLQFVDGLREGALVVGATGVVLHESVALRRMLCDDQGGSQLKAEMLQIALVVTAVVQRRRDGRAMRSSIFDPVSREVRTARARYRLSGTWLEPEMVAAGGAAMVTLECLTPRAMTAAELCQRFALTPREVEVARFIARGRSAPEVARLLNISPHTARHHVEALRRKLGVHHAGEIAPALTAE